MRNTALVGVIRSKSAAYPQGRFLACVCVQMGLLRNRSQRRKKPAGLWRRARERGPEPAPLSVEPLSTAVDLLMKRAVPTLRFSAREPRFPQTGLSLW
jgi:hypothetical protein